MYIYTEPNRDCYRLWSKSLKKRRKTLVNFLKDFGNVFIHRTQYVHCHLWAKRLKRQDRPWWTYSKSLLIYAHTELNIPVRSPAFFLKPLRVFPMLVVANTGSCVLCVCVCGRGRGKMASRTGIRTHKLSIPSSLSCQLCHPHPLCTDWVHRLSSSHREWIHTRTRVLWNGPFQMNIHELRSPG